MAAGGITAAAVWVDVLPSLKGAASSLSKDARTLGGQAGKGIADETSRSISQRSSSIGTGLQAAFTRVQQAAVTAGQRIGRTFSAGVNTARAALDRFRTGWSALDSATARSAGRLGQVGAAARSAFDTAARPVQNFVAGFRSSDAAASALTGRLGALGGQARSVFNSAAAPVQNFAAGFRSSDAAASALTGRMGSLGGAARSALTTAAAPLQNFASGFRSSDAAASAFTGRMGSLGGATRGALTSAAAPLQNLVGGFRSSDAAASVFSGRMGTVGGAVRSAMTSASGAMSGFAAQVNTKADEVATSISGGIGGSMRSIATQAGGLAAAAGLGTLGYSAISAASNIQNTRLTLTGMYNSAADANDMMTRLSNLSRSSPIDYSAYANAATQLAYMGYKGQDAEGILRNVGAAITAAGGSSMQMDQATRAMLQMVNSGRVYAAQLGQISDAGIPVFSGLAAHFNTNIDNVRQMVTEGKVSIDDVMATISQAQGDTFQQMIRASEQVTGSMSNQWAIFKDNFVQGLGAMLLPIVTQYGPMLGQLGAIAGEALARVPGILASIGNSYAFQGIVAGLRAIWTFAQPVLGFLLQFVGIVVGSAFAVFGTILGGIGNALAWLLPYLRPLQPLLAGVAVALLTVRGAMMAHAAAVAIAGAATAGYRAAMAGATIATNAHTIAARAGAASAYLIRGAMAVAAVATWALTSATWAQAMATWGVNSALLANPITWVVILIIALVAAVIYAYTHFAWFRDTVNAVWAAIVTAAQWLWDSIVAVFNAVWSFLSNWGTTILAVFLPFLGIPLLVYQYWTPISAFFVNLWTGILGFFAMIWNAIRGVVMTVWSAITGWLAAMFVAHYALWMQIWNGIVGFFTGAWNWIRDTAVGVWNAIAAYFAGAFAVFSVFFSTVWNGISAAFMFVWNFIRNTAVTVWNAIVAFLTPAFLVFSAFFSAVWNGISAFFGFIWGAISNTAISVWNAISGFFGGAFAGFTGFFAGVWNNIWRIFTDIWNGIAGTARAVWDGIVGIVRGAVNGVIDAANWMTDKINVVLRFLLIPLIPGIPRLESGGIIGMARGGMLPTATQSVQFAAAGTKIGGGFVTNGPTVVTGEGRRAYPEYVVPTDPAYRGRAMALHSSLSADLGVTAGAGSAGMAPMGATGSTPQLAEGGILGWIGNAADWVWQGVTSAASTVGGALSDAAQWMGGGITGIMRQIQDAVGSMIPAGIFHGALGSLVPKVVGAVKAKIDALMATQAGGVMGATSNEAPGIVRIISDVARGRFGGLARKAAITGVATGLVESNLRNIPGGDRDSLGVFQQRPSQGWGTPAQIMNVTYAAGKFFSRFPGNWAAMEQGALAQSVQRSAFPGRYAQRMGQAAGLVNQFGGFDLGGLASGAGVMAKQVIAPERVLSPRQTEAFEALVPMLQNQQAILPTSPTSPGDSDARQDPIVVNVYPREGQSEQQIADNVLRRLDFYGQLR